MGEHRLLTRRADASWRGREVEREMRNRGRGNKCEATRKSRKITSEEVRSGDGEISVRNSDRVRRVRGLKV